MNISRIILVTVFALGALYFAGLTTSHADVFLEKDGIIAIEAESTTSSLGQWEKKTDVEDYSGECHLEFTGNKTTNGPPKSKLTYKFKVNKTGKYQLTIRARKRLETDRQDISNDCFVAVKGNYEAGGDTPLSILKADTKIFGGHADKWAWAVKLDVNHKKWLPIYNFEAGETYELVVHGRSKNFNIDRFLFIHETNNLKKTQQANPKESAKLSNTTTPVKKRVKRTLKNKTGTEIEAELMKLEGDTLTILKQGLKFEIPLNSLSDEDIAFVKKWASAGI